MNSNSLLAPRGKSAGLPMTTAWYNVLAVEGDHRPERRGFNHSIVVALIDRDGMVRKTHGNGLSPETEVIINITSLLKY